MKKMISNTVACHLKNQYVVILLSFLGSLAFAPAYAQPANDVCSGAQTIVPDGTCVGGTTVDAGDHWINTVGCQAGNNVNEVWYSFTADSTSIIINLTAGTITGDLEVIVVEAEFGCSLLFLAGSSCGPSVLIDTISGLTVGIDYLFTINSTGSDGTFTICVTSYTGPVEPGQDCSSAVSLCDTSKFGVGIIADGAGAVFGNGSEEDLSALTCFGGDERQSQWYTFTCRVTGTIEFNINPVVNTDDYDWALFDNTTANCLLNTNAAPVIACNWSGCDGATGLSSSPSNEPGSNTCGGPASACGGGNYERAFCNTTTASMTPPTITAGQTYVLIIDNFSVSNSGFDFIWGGATGGMTAEIGVLSAFTASTSCSSNDADVTATSYPNISTYTWTWGDATSTVGSATETHTYSNPGTYIIALEVTDAVGCTDITSLTIEVGSGPTLSMDSTMISCNGGTDGTATGNASAGLAPYTYLWNDPSAQTDSFATGLGAGTYTITVTDNNGCTYSDSVTITEPPVLVPAAGSDVAICSGGSTSIGGAPTASGGTTPYTYAWNQASSLDDSTLANPTASPTSNTTFTILLTDSAGCTASDDIIITVDATATVAAGSDATICQGDTYTLSGSFGGSASSITWTGGDGSFDNAALPAATYTPGSADSTAGSVALTITTDDPAGACPAVQESMVLTINTAASADANVDAAICEGATYTFSGAIGGSATSSVWTFGGGDGSFDNAALLNATYTPGSNDVLNGTVTLTLTTNDPAGPCPDAQDSMVLTIDQAATVAAGGDATICQGDTYTLSGSSGGSASSITWTGGDGSFDNAALPAATYTPGSADSTAGSVTLTITTDDPAGSCPAVQESMVLTINTMASADANVDDAICEGATYTLSGAIGGSATSSVWNGGDGTFNDTTLLNATYTPGSADISAGSVTLTLTTNDPAGTCPAVANAMVLTITAKDDPAFSYSSGTFCQTGSDPTPVITGTAGGTFSSSPAGLVFISTATGEVDLSASALSTFTIQYTTNGTCPDSSTINIAITTSTNATFFYNDTINPDTVFCQDGVNPLPVYIAGASAGTYSATPAGLEFVNVSSGEVDLIASNPGTYTVENYITASGGCGADSSYRTVIVEQKATVSAGSNATICQGSTLLLAGSIADSATSSIWSSSGDGTFDDSTLQAATYTPGSGDLLTGSAILTITTNDPVGICQLVQDSITITINTATTVSASTNDTICDGNPYTLNGSFGGSATSSVWSTAAGDGTFDNVALPNATYTPGSADLAAGSVSLTITTDDPAGPCPAALDSMVLAVDSAATVTAGTNATICQGDDHLLSGSIGGNATSSVWTFGGGDGSFDNAALLNATYTPGSNDVSNGTITLTLTTNDPAGPCPAVADSIVLTINQATTASASTNDTICDGNTYTLNGSFGGSATSSVWSTSVGDGTFDNATLTNATYTPGSADLAAGSVTLTITTDDPLGPCPAALDSMVLAVDSAATASAGTNATICQGEDHLLSGTIGGNATGSLWSSSGDGTFDDSTLQAATYTPGSNDISNGTATLTITSDDPTGPCPAVADSIVLTINQATTVSASTNDTICDGNAYTLNGSFGGSATSSVWSTATGDGTFDNATLTNATYTPGSADLAAGSVTLTITTDDPLGPCPVALDSMVLAVDSAATATAGTAATICQGGDYLLSGTIGGNATGSLWSSSGDGTFDDSTLQAATYTPGSTDISNGTVTLTITSNDPAGPCPAVADSMVLTINQATMASASTNDTICDGNAYTLNGSFGGSATSSVWSTSAGDGTFDNAALTNATYTPGSADLAAGSVTLTITTDDPAGVCPAAMDSMILAVDSAATTTAGTDATICQGEDHLLSGTIDGNATGSVWSSSGDGSFDDNTLQAATYTPGSADISNGTATLTITSNDPAGPCPAVADSMVLTINPAPAMTISSTNASCGLANGEAIATPNTGTGPFSFQWDANTGSQTDSTAAGLGAGSYWVTITDALGCTASDSTFITDAPPLVITTSTVDATCGASDGYAVVTVSGGTSPYSYSWNDLSAQTTDTATSLGAGVYTIVITDSNGCVESNLVNINNVGGASIAVDSVVDLACNGDASGAISITITGGSTPLTFLWSNMATTEDISALDAGAYTVTLTDSAGCIATMDTVITEPTALVITTTSTNISCFGADDGAATATVTGGASPYTYLWNDLLAQTTMSALGLSAGTFTVRITDTAGCSALDSITITEPSAIVVNILTTDNCLGEASATATATASGGSGTLTYAWDTSPAQTNATATGLASGNYTVTVVDTSGCIATAAAMVNSIALPTISAGDDETIALGTSINLSASGGLFYNWTPPQGLSCTSCQNPVAAPVTTTEYIVFGTDANNCSSSDTITVFVDDKISLFLPDVFSPNGDGENDYVFVQGKGIKVVEKFIIYDRWGEKIFENTNFSVVEGQDANKLQGWDGTYNGALMNPGVFVYYVKVLFTNDSIQEEKGDFTLVH